MLAKNETRCRSRPATTCRRQCRKTHKVLALTANAAFVWNSCYDIPRHRRHSLLVSQITYALESRLSGIALRDRCHAGAFADPDRVLPLDIDRRHRATDDLPTGIAPDRVKVDAVRRLCACVRAGWVRSTYLRPRHNRNSTTCQSRQQENCAYQNPSRLPAVLTVTHQDRSCDSQGLVRGRPHWVSFRGTLRCFYGGGGG